MAITVIDVEFDEYLRWRRALRPHRATVRKLLTAFNTEARRLLGKQALALLKSSANLVNRMLGGAYREEMEEIAGALDVTLADVLLANLAYDGSTIGGCTTFITSTRRGIPLHARNLDWEFPRGLLRKYTSLFRIYGAPAGDYLAVGWPGLFGILTALKPSRFSVTVNLVQHLHYTSSLKLTGRALKGYWPSTWVTRQVMDEATSYSQARQQLERAFLLSPILYAVAGIAEKEAVIIERSPAEYAERRTQMGSPCLVTNHYVSDEFEDDNVDLSEMDSKERYSYLSRALGRYSIQTTDDAIKLLSRPALFGDMTQHQVVMCPKEGELVVRVPGRAAETFSLR